MLLGWLSPARRARHGAPVLVLALQDVASPLVGVFSGIQPYLAGGSLWWCPSGRRPLLVGGMRRLPSDHKRGGSVLNLRSELLLRGEPACREPTSSKTQNGSTPTWRADPSLGAGYRTRTGARSLEGCCAAITPIPRSATPRFYAGAPAGAKRVGYRERLTHRPHRPMVTARTAIQVWRRGPDARREGRPQPGGCGAGGYSRHSYKLAGRSQSGCSTEERERP